MSQILKGLNLTRPDGSTALWVHLITASEPASLDIASEDISGLPADITIAAGSTIIWPGGSAVLYEDGGTFTKVEASSDAVAVVS